MRFKTYEDLDRKSATRNVHQRAVVKILLKFTRVQGGTHNNDFDVRAILGNLLKSHIVFGLAGCLKSSYLE